MNQKKKRLLARILAGFLVIVFILLLFSSVFKVQAAEHPVMNQIRALSDFKIVYVIDGRQITVGADAVNYSLVTVHNLEAVRTDMAHPSNAGSGKVVMAHGAYPLPNELYETAGYITDAAGNVMLSEAALYNYLAAVLAPFQTAGKERLFMTSTGVLRSVGGGNYGSLIDMKAELEHLVSVITNHVTEARFPVWAQTAFQAAGGSALPTTYAEPVPAAGFLPVIGNALYDIGSTYVEIDLTAQQLYYYQDGALILSTPVVTGDVRLKRGTPTGVFYLYGKQTNRTLRGEDYEAFVRYWMPIYKNIGMHDASWRGRFGGSIYQTNGSHGCINLPSSAAKKLYENLAMGTPVVVYE